MTGARASAPLIRESTAASAGLGAIPHASRILNSAIRQSVRASASRSRHAASWLTARYSLPGCSRICRACTDTDWQSRSAAMGRIARHSSAASGASDAYPRAIAQAASSGSAPSIIA